jgi:hypothetical protein
MYSELLHVSASHVAKMFLTFALYKITDILRFLKFRYILIGKKFYNVEKNITN